MKTYILLLVVTVLCSCGSITDTLDKYALKKEVMDQVLADSARATTTLISAFAVADANDDGEVRGLEWIEFVRSAVEQFKDIRGLSSNPIKPVTLEALQQSGVILTEPMLAVEGGIEALKSRPK